MSFEELQSAIAHARSINDASAIEKCIGELDKLDTMEARAMAAFARGARASLNNSYVLASECYREAIELYEAHGDRRGVARAKSNLGLAENQRSNFHRSFEYFNDALALFQELDDLSGVADSICNIGVYYFSIGNHSSALEHFNRSLALHQKIGNRKHEAHSLGNIGAVYANTGQYPLALEFFFRTLAVDEEIHDTRGIAGSLNNIGTVYSKTGDFALALEYYHRALSINEDLGDRSKIAQVCGNIGNVHKSAGNHQLALEYLHRALHAHESTESRSSVAGAINNIGSLHESLKNYPLAEDHYRRALAQYTELDDLRGIVLAMNNLVGTSIHQGKISEAENLLSLVDTKVVDDPDRIINIELHRSSIQESRGMMNDAKATLERVLILAIEHTLPTRQIEIHRQLRDLALKQSNLSDYVKHNNEFTRITEEVKGVNTATKLAMQEKQREIEAKERETEKHMAVLHSTLPKHIADRVAKGETINDHYDNAAVIFVDIVGFTTLSSTLTSQHLTTLLDNVFAICDESCSRNKVTRVKTIGDSYLAFSDIDH